MKALKETGEVSSIRIALFAVVAVIIILIMSVSIYIIMSIFMSIALNWSGMAAFMASIGALLTPAFGSKALQKKYEGKNSNDKND